jgi:hypothetical protein
MGYRMSRFPTDEEFGYIQVNYPTPELDLVPHEVALLLCPETWDACFRRMEINDWILHLSNRMIQARDSYHLMMFYFERGIPDARPWISPGINGDSITYFPDFSDDDHINKASFNFYADAFFSQLTSSWNTIGHLLNVVHQLNLKPRNIYFKTAVTKLNETTSGSGVELYELLKSPEYENFNNTRNDVTHNFLPGMFGGIVQRTDNDKIVSVGVGRYVASDDIVKTAKDALQIFNKTLCVAGLRPPLPKP